MRLFKILRGGTRLAGLTRRQRFPRLGRYEGLVFIQGERHATRAVRSVLWKLMTLMAVNVLRCWRLGTHQLGYINGCKRGNYRKRWVGLGHTTEIHELMLLKLLKLLRLLILLILLRLMRLLRLLRWQIVRGSGGRCL